MTGEDGAATAVHDALTLQTEEYEVRRKLVTNDRHVVHEVIFGGRRAVCKVARNNTTGLHRDVLVRQRVACESPVPVADVLARGENYYVAEWADGTAYDGDAPVECRKKRLRDAGATLAELHQSLSFDAYGELRPAGDSNRPTCLELNPVESWSELFLTWVEQWRDDLTGTAYETLGDEVVAFVRDQRAAFDGAGRPTLAHADYESDNIRFDQRRDRVASVLDWEVACATPGEYDLARAELGWFEKPISPEADSELRSSLLSGYESVRSLSPEFDARRAAYRAALTLRPLRKLSSVASRADVPNDRLGEVMVSFVRHRLEFAQDRL